jgi:hypothetical protein
VNAWIIASVGYFAVLGAFLMSLCKAARIADDRMAAAGKDL